jgi:pilus assembly protein Flp/PilA
MFKRFLNNQRGVTAIEYALIAGLIFLVIVTAVGSIGTSLSGTFGNVSGGLSGASAG